MNQLQKKIVALLSERCDAIDAEHLSNQSETVQADLIFDEPGLDFSVWIFADGHMFIHSAEDEEYAQAEIDNALKEI